MKADELLERFHVGTAKRWPGATVFWIVDEQQRVRGGQVVLFKENWHRTEDHVESAKSCLTWQYKRRGESIPAWLEHNETWPVPFGLHQIGTEPLDKPVAIVEACKTAIVCAGHSPQFVWLAIGSKSYPTARRLAALRDRTIMLYPDLKAYVDWSRRADVLRAEGFNIRVSSRLEDHATDWQLGKGLDMADFLVKNSSTPAREGPETVDEPPPASEPLRVVTTMAEWKHGTILRPDPTQLEYL